MPTLPHDGPVTMVEKANPPDADGTHDIVESNETTGVVTHTKGVASAALELSCSSRMAISQEAMSALPSSDPAATGGRREESGTVYAPSGTPSDAGETHRNHSATPMSTKQNGSNVAADASPVTLSSFSSASTVRMMAPYIHLNHGNTQNNNNNDVSGGGGGGAGSSLVINPFDAPHSGAGGTMTGGGVGGDIDDHSRCGTTMTTDRFTVHSSSGSLVGLQHVASGKAHHGVRFQDDGKPPPSLSGKKSCSDAGGIGCVSSPLRRGKTTTTPVNTFASESSAPAIMGATAEGPLRRVIAVMGCEDVDVAAADGTSTAFTKSQMRHQDDDDDENEDEEDPTDFSSGVGSGQATRKRRRRAEGCRSLTTTASVTIGSNSTSQRGKQSSSDTADDDEGGGASSRTTRLNGAPISTTATSSGSSCSNGENMSESNAYQTTWYGYFRNPDMEDAFIEFKQRDSLLPVSLWFIVANISILVDTLSHPRFLKHGSNALDIVNCALAGVVLVVFGFGCLISRFCGWWNAPKYVERAWLAFMISQQINGPIQNSLRTPDTLGQDWRYVFNYWVSSMMIVAFVPGNPRFAHCVGVFVIGCIVYALCKVPIFTPADVWFPLSYVPVLLLVYHANQLMRRNFIAHREALAQRERAKVIHRKVSRLIGKRLPLEMAARVGNGNLVSDCTHAAIVVIHLRCVHESLPLIALPSDDLQDAITEMVNDMEDARIELFGLPVAGNGQLGYFSLLFDPVEGKAPPEHRACAFAYKLSQGWNKVTSVLRRAGKLRNLLQTGIGVHSGNIHGGVLPDQILQYQVFGPVSGIARRLAEVRIDDAFCVSAVHVSSKVQDALPNDGHVNLEATASELTIRGYGGAIGTQPTNTVLTAAPTPMSTTTAPLMSDPSLTTESIMVSYRRLVCCRLEIHAVSTPQRVQGQDGGGTGDNNNNNDDDDHQWTNYSKASTNRFEQIRSSRKGLKASFAATAPVAGGSHSRTAGVTNGGDAKGDVALEDVVSVGPSLRSLWVEKDAATFGQRASRWSTAFADESLEAAFGSYSAAKFCDRSRWGWLAFMLWQLLVLVPIVALGYHESPFLPLMITTIVLCIVMFFVSSQLVKLHRWGPIVDGVAFDVYVTLNFVALRSTNLQAPMYNDPPAQGTFNAFYIAMMAMLRGQDTSRAWFLPALMFCLPNVLEAIAMFVAQLSSNSTLVYFILFVIFSTTNFSAFWHNQLERQVFVDVTLGERARKETEEEHSNVAALLSRTVPRFLIDSAATWMGRGRPAGELRRIVPMVVLRGTVDFVRGQAEDGAARDASQVTGNRGTTRQNVSPAAFLKTMSRLTHALHQCIHRYPRVELVRFVGMEFIAIIRFDANDEAPMVEGHGGAADASSVYQGHEMVPIPIPGSSVDHPGLGGTTRNSTICRQDVAVVNGSALSVAAAFVASLQELPSMELSLSSSSLLRPHREGPNDAGAMVDLDDTVVVNEQWLPRWTVTTAVGPHVVGILGDEIECTVERFTPLGPKLAFL